MAGVVGTYDMTGDLSRPLLVVFGGLPGTGKTSIARTLADALGATFVRVDSIEVAIERTGVSLLGLPAGYSVAHAVAGDQLRSLRPVVVDAVNPVHVARDGWQRLAAECAASLRFVHVVLHDEAEHQRRVEARVADIEGHELPTWADVQGQLHDEWTEPHLELDNSSSLDQAVVTVLRWLSDPSDL